MQKVKDLINEIKQERENTKNSNHYNTRSIRDEVSVMIKNMKFLFIIIMD